MCRDLNAAPGPAVATAEENVSLHNFLCLFVTRIFVMDVKSRISTSSSGNKKHLQYLRNVCGERVM